MHCPSLFKVALILCGGLITAPLIHATFFDNSVGEVVSEQFWLKFSDYWEFSKDSDTSLAEGKFEVKEGKFGVLSYDFEKGGDFVTVKRSLESCAIDSLTSLYLLAQGPAGPVAVNLTDSTDQVLTYELGSIAQGEKRVLKANLESPDAVSGGAADKKIHFPIKTISIVVKKSPPLLKGSLTIERLSLKVPESN